MLAPKPLRAFRLTAGSLLLTFSIHGCGGGGGDAAGPEDSFPDVSGIYNISGGFDDLTHDQASFVGSLTLTQASRQSGQLSGTMSVTANLDGDVTTAGNVPIVSASVTPDGTVSFQLGSLSNGGSWTFTGSAAGETIAGRHTLTDGESSFSGNWTASTGSVGTGALTVVVSTSGSDLDPDGYVFAVDGAGRGAVNGSAPVTISGLAQGNHSVELGGIANNCQVDGDNPRLVAISPSATATVTFSVVCSTPQAEVGIIHVTTTTAGADPDPNGYQLTLDATPPQPIGSNAQLDLPNVPVGGHTLVLTDVATNCRVEDASRRVTVAPGATSTVAFEISCEQIPPAVGSVRVTTVTSGPSQDPDGYRFAIDAGGSQPIGSSDGVTVTGLPAGAHTVVLSGVAENCSVTGGPSKEVTVTPGGTAEAAFAIACTSTGPSASRSTITGDESIPAGPSGSSTITVTVLDASGAALAGVPVTLSATGEGNTITPASATSAANGVATFSFSSSVAGNKTVTATAGGITLANTLGISVFRNASTTAITSITPEPSSPGESVRVTVQVSGEGGGTPTGTVAVFSLQVTGGCEAAPLDGAGVATCEFALSAPGTYTIDATYSGDDQFEDSSADGQSHVVSEPSTSNQRASR